MAFYGKYKEFNVPYNIENNEGDFYCFIEGNKSLLIKEIEYDEVKEQIIRLLIKHREEIGIEYLVYPERFYDGKNLTAEAD